MFATGKNVGILQNQNPITPEEESSLKQAFRAKYLQQIKMWYLVQKNSKKRALMEFLKLWKTHKQPKRPSTAMHEMKPSDFILRSSTGTIDFRLSFNGRPCSRKNNRQRFSSSGIYGQDIFGETEPAFAKASEKETKRDTLAQFVLKKLMNDSFAEKMLPYADENYNLLNELQEWVDKKANALPVPLFSEPDDLNPNKERTLNSKTIREDHLGSIRSPKTKSRLPYMERSWHPPATAYNDFFGDELKGKLDKPFYPVERSHPFSKFPAKELPPVSITPTEFREQSTQNKEFGKNYKNIFLSKTVL